MEADLNLIVMGFIVLLIGVVFTGVIGDSVYDLTEFSDFKANESFTAVSGTAVSLAFGNLTGTQYVYNGTTGAVDSTNYTISAADGTVTLGSDNESKAYNQTSLKVDYDHERNDYLDDTASRTLMTLTLLFFAIAVMIAGAAIAMKGLGVIEK